ncbi:Rossmann-like and DUF2520 domain-containing protein [Legionella spiritensis]|uniref:Rossmann-like and DUF2520 domain-containing protein n=1 Tax=Legionella spiritensis TaxID=452 RepID=UPI000F6D75DB|nr:DUF2520 domain-containing protein [Legionella spiritensis]VEG91560.1 cyclohexadienyl dehydrogenase [Legionella spiritensis]
MKLTFSVIGAGRLGTSIACALVSQDLAALLQICNRHLEKAQRVVELIGAGEAIATTAALAPASLTFITVPDDKILIIAERLAREKRLIPGSVVVHCSGALNADVLRPLADQGCHTASVHPLRAFSGNPHFGNRFNQCDCVVEGDAVACQRLIPLFDSLGAHVMTIDSTYKASYHVAATIASNYLITLAAEATELLKKSGVNPSQAKRMISNLMQGSLENITRSNEVKEALTGPLARGDAATIALHLQAISNSSTKALYRAAGLATLSLTDLGEQQQQELSQLLNDVTGAC